MERCLLYDVGWALFREDDSFKIDTLNSVNLDCKSVDLHSF